MIDLLSKFRCGDKWCLWIKECISIASLSILINGSPSKEFKIQKGICQGDPLSPFLFNVVVEGLNLLLKRASGLNYIKGTRIGRNGVVVCHFQFADDTLLFCNNDKEEIVNIKRILRCFQILSGLKINFSKSSLCSVKIPIHEVKEMAQILGCKVEVLLIKYLGLPLGVNPNKIKA